MLRPILALYILLAPLACSHAQPPADAPTPESEETSAAPRTDCGRACLRLRQLACPEGQATRSGQTCYRLCEARQADLRPACVAVAGDVAAVKQCGVRCVE